MRQTNFIPTPQPPSASRQIDTMLQFAHTALHARRFAEAAQLARQALTLAPRHVVGNLLLARATRLNGQAEDAIALCRRVLAWSAGQAATQTSALSEMAMAQRQAGRLDEAEATYRRALEIDPDGPMLRHNLANLLQRRQAWDEAETHYRRAIALAPAMAEAHTELGNLLVAQPGRQTEGRLCYAQALSVRPDFLPAWQKLSASLDPDAAAQGIYDLQRHAGHAGTTAHLLDCMAEAALKLDPDNPLGHYTRGVTLRFQGRLADALPLFDKVMALPAEHPLHRQALYLYTVSLMEMGEHGRAMQGARRLLTLSADQEEQAKSHQLLGGMTLDLGLADEAIALYRQAIALAPGFLPSRISLCATHLYASGEDASKQPMLARELIGATFPEPMAVHHANTPDPDRRLKIGYLSGDFRQHSCAYFLAPLFTHHDPDQVELHAYATGMQEDEFTMRLAQLVGYARWRRVSRLDDDALAEAIRADGIDILIDLAGLTDGNRLGALALKPAPVLLNWLGFLGSNGLPVMDGRITDALVDPLEGSGWQGSEPALRLPRTYLAYEPPANAPDVAPPPMLAKGHPTFGSFNSLAKLSDACLASWCCVLREIPDARLMIKSKALRDVGMQQALRARLAAQGVAPDRVAMEGWRADNTHHLAAYADVDVALDSHPFNGVTTTCEASWMGVPVVSLVGTTPAARQGLTLLHALGRPERAVTTVDELVAVCKALVSQPGQLAQERLTARARMRASVLMDGPGLAAAMEALYRQAWRAWCAKQAG